MTRKFHHHRLNHDTNWKRRRTLTATRPYRSTYSEALHFLQDQKVYSDMPTVQGSALFAKVCIHYEALQYLPKIKAYIIRFCTMCQDQNNITGYTYIM